MPFPVDNPAALSCGCNHQQNFGGMIAGGDFTQTGEADMAGGTYTLNGEPCEITDIIDTAHAGGNFDPITDIDAGGVKPNKTFYIKEPLLSTMLENGFSMVLEVSWTTEVVSVYSASYDAGENDSIECYWGDPGAGDRLTLYALGVDTDTWTTPADLPIDDQVNKLALTYAADHMAASVNGAAIRRIEAPGIDATMAMFYFTFAAPGGTNARLRSFAIYETVDDADLPSLSDA